MLHNNLRKLNKNHNSRRNFRNGVNQFILPSWQAARIRDTCLVTRRSGQREVFGWVYIDVHHELYVDITVNRSRDPGKFLYHNSDVIHAKSKEFHLNRQLIGTFHSHIVSEAVPSKTDMQAAFYPMTALIYDICGNTFGFWQINATGELEILKLSVYPISGHDNVLKDYQELPRDVTMSLSEYAVLKSKVDPD